MSFPQSDKANDSSSNPYAKILLVWVVVVPFSLASVATIWAAVIGWGEILPYWMECLITFIYTLLAAALMGFAIAGLWIAASLILKRLRSKRSVALAPIVPLEIPPTLTALVLPPAREAAKRHEAARVI